MRFSARRQDTAPETTATAAITPAMTRNSSMSASRLGRTTMMTAPSMGPMRDLRPPSVTASRNWMASSMPKLLGATYCSE